MRRMLVVFIAFVVIASDSSTAENPGQYQKTAAAALQSQMAPEGKDCPDARTTYDANVCIAAVEGTIQRDFDVFYRNLLALLDSTNQQRVALQQLELRTAQMSRPGCQHRGKSALAVTRGDDRS